MDLLPLGATCWLGGAQELVAAGLARNRSRRRYNNSGGGGVSIADMEERKDVGILAMDIDFSSIRCDWRSSRCTRHRRGRWLPSVVSSSQHPSSLRTPPPPPSAVQGWPRSVHDMRVFNDAILNYGKKFPHPVLGTQAMYKEARYKPV